MTSIFVKENIMKEINKVEEKYDIQQKQIDDAGYNEEDLGDLLNKMAEQCPILDRLWIREQLWSRKRGLEEAIRIIEEEESKPGLYVAAH